MQLTLAGTSGANQEEEKNYIIHTFQIIYTGLHASRKKIILSVTPQKDTAFEKIEMNA